MSRAGFGRLEARRPHRGCWRRCFDFGARVRVSDRRSERVGGPRVGADSPKSVGRLAAPEAALIMAIVGKVRPGTKGTRVGCGH